MKVGTLDYRNRPQDREITNAGKSGMREEADESTGRDGAGQLEGQSASTALSTKEGDKQLEGIEASAQASKDEVMESFSDPEYSLAVEVAYHGMQQNFLSAAHRWMMFLTIIFGASAALPFWGEKICALLAAATAAADMAFDFTGRAQAHADFRRRYFEMVSALARGELQDFGARWMVISADEPPLYKYVDIIAERETCIAHNREMPERLTINWWQRLTAHLRRG